MAAARSEVSHAINRLSTTVLSSMEYDEESMISITKDENGKVQSIDYDTKNLNKVLEHAITTIDNSLKAASKGEEDPILGQVFFADGVVYEIALGTLTHISFLNNVGPKIPIRMQIANHASGNIITLSEPYGINNTMIKIVLRLKIEAEVMSVLSVSSVTADIEIPLVIQIVNGDIPNYLPFTSQSTGN